MAAYILPPIENLRSVRTYCKICIDIWAIGGWEFDSHLAHSFFQVYIYIFFSMFFFLILLLLRLQHSFFWHPVILPLVNTKVPSCFLKCSSTGSYISPRFHSKTKIRKKLFLPPYGRKNHSLVFHNDQILGGSVSRSSVVVKTRGWILSHPLKLIIFSSVRSVRASKRKKMGQNDAFYYIARNYKPFLYSEFPY